MSSSGLILPPEFYARETITVAEELLGKRLIRTLKNGKRLSARIVEVEAYLGIEDPAAHTYGGRRTPRNESMYGNAGFTYVYLIYGLHHCVNIVTQMRDVPEAVLLRALEPIEGFDEFKLTHAQLPPHKWLNGPGKLCAGLNITRAQNGLAVFEAKNPLTIEDDISVRREDIAVDRRVGIDYSGDAREWPLRFGIRGNSNLSPVKFED